LEHEVLGEPLNVTLDGLHESACFDLIQIGQVGVEHHALTANKVDAAFNDVHGRWHLAE
jgi:hypothetical protein